MLPVFRKRPRQNQPRFRWWSMLVVTATQSEGNPYEIRIPLRRCVWASNPDDQSSSKISTVWPQDIFPVGHGWPIWVLHDSAWMCRDQCFHIHRHWRAAWHLTLTVGSMHRPERSSGVRRCKGGLKCSPLTSIYDTRWVFQLPNHDLVSSLIPVDLVFEDTWEMSKWIQR